MSSAVDSDVEEKNSLEAVESFQLDLEVKYSAAADVDIKREPSDDDETCEPDGDDSEDGAESKPAFDTSKLKVDTIGHKIMDPELDFEEEVVHDFKEDLPLKDTDPEDEGVVPEKDDDDHEEGEADEGEVSDDDDMEEGEVKDGLSSRKTQPRPICRFFNKGQCTWGTSCRFIHPGVNDKGNYNMFAPNKPVFGPNMMLPGPPPPVMMMMMGPGPNFGPRIGMRGPDVPFSPVVEDAAPPVESAWERGLRHAKEILKKASRRKEQEPDFEEKRVNLSIDSSDKCGPSDYDKENDYYGRSPPYRHSDLFNYKRYDEPPDVFESSDRESREVWRSGRFENFEVRWPRQDFENRERSDKERSRYHQRSYDREKYDRRSQDDERLREDAPTRGDEWRDPWRRSKTPKGRSHSRARSRRSYSSGTTHSFSSRSSRTSYTYSRSSSSKSSYFSSDSYSRSRSRSPFSHLDSHSPPGHHRSYRHMRMDPGHRRRPPFHRSRSPIRSGRSPPPRSPHSPPLRVQRSPPLRTPRSPPRMGRSPPLRVPRSPPFKRSPIGMARHRMSPDATKHIPLPPTPVPVQQPLPVAKDEAIEVSSESRPSDKVESRGRKPRNYSGSESSRSLSRSVSRSSSSASRSRSRSLSRSRSYSHSISMSSVSSASGSDSSSESGGKKSPRLPFVKPSKNLEQSRKKGDKSFETKAATKMAAESSYENENDKTVLPKTVDAAAVREKRITATLPKQLHSNAMHAGQPVIAPVPRVSKDMLRQKPQIKLTLLSKAPPPPSALERSPVRKDATKQKTTERDEASQGAKKDTQASHARKRPASPSSVKPVAAVAPSLNKRSTSSRREELLKQLKAVEDAIARKRAKII